MEFSSRSCAAPLALVASNVKARSSSVTRMSGVPAGALLSGVPLCLTLNPRFCRARLKSAAIACSSSVRASSSSYFDICPPIAWNWNADWIRVVGPTGSTLSGPDRQQAHHEGSTPKALHCVACELQHHRTNAGYCSAGPVSVKTSAGRRRRTEGGKPDVRMLVDGVLEAFDQLAEGLQIAPLRPLDEFLHGRPRTCAIPQSRLASVLPCPPARHDPSVDTDAVRPQQVRCGCGSTLRQSSGLPRTEASITAPGARKAPAAWATGRPSGCSILDTGWVRL